MDDANINHVIEYVHFMICIPWQVVGFLSLFSSSCLLFMFYFVTLVLYMCFVCCASLCKIEIVNIKQNK